MNPEELASVTANELAMIEETVESIKSLETNIADQHSVAAIAFYLHSIYGGVENVLVRFLKFHRMEKPRGEAWHVELIELFSSPGHPPLPLLFSDVIMPHIHALRGFRHVVRSNYAVNLDWPKLKPNVDGLDAWLEPWQAAVRVALQERMGG